MPDIKPVVTLTSSTTEKISRHDLLDWVNSTASGQYKKIEDLCSGVAYCQMMEQLFPQCIGLKKIKPNAKLEHERIHNLKLLQTAFGRLKIEKSVPIDRLIKARFQDNFEFLQWFKKFFDIHVGGTENNNNITNIKTKTPTLLVNTPTPIRKNLSTPKSNPKSNSKATPKSAAKPEGQSVSPGSLSVLQETQTELSSQIGLIEHERNWYYSKLIKIEELLKNSMEENVLSEWCQRGLDILHAADYDGESIETETMPILEF